MSKFNTAYAPQKTENLSGGEAYKQSSELELVSIMLTSFANDQYYRSEGDTFKKIQELINSCNPEFVAKAAIYARTSFGMRSITHVIASELAKYCGGKSWAKNFYDKIIYRPDDMMEILSYHTAKNGKVPNSMKKGFASAIGRFDKYSLAKYRNEGKAFKLVDVVNLVHPVPNEKNQEALSLLIRNELKSFDTWETELSKTGQIATSEDEKMDLKKGVWIDLVREKKIKYFALLRNLRNIIEQAPEVLDEALEMLLDEQAIKKSLVLPFRFITAFETIKSAPLDGMLVRKVLVALSKAVDISLSNVPQFPGRTLVVLDVSGSMAGKPAEIGSLFSAILVKANNADMMIFDNIARYINVNTLDSTMTIANSLRFNGGSTNFNSIFHAANRKYDRVIILSDMQGWVGYNTPTQSFNQYKRLTGSNPFVYSFDLQGYGTMQFPEQNVFCLAGFSDKVFDIMSLMEQDKKALINKINSIEL